jgi:hypothetical protein
VQDLPDACAEVGEELADLLLPRRQAPLRKEHLRIVGKQVENAAAAGRHAFVVERLEILQRHRLALVVGHHQSRDRHVPSLRLQHEMQKLNATIGVNGGLSSASADISTTART